MPRNQPDVVLGGSLVRLDDGYLAIPSYSYGGSSQQVVQQVYSNAIHKRYTPTWDGKALDAALITRFTDRSGSSWRVARRTSALSLRITRATAKSTR